MSIIRVFVGVVLKTVVLRGVISEFLPDLSATPRAPSSVHSGTHKGPRDRSVLSFSTFWPKSRFLALFRRARRQNPRFGAKNRPKSLFLGRFSRRRGSRREAQHFCAPGARSTCGNGLVGTSPKLCLSRISIFCLRTPILTFQCGRDGRFLPVFRCFWRQKASKTAVFC